MKYILSYKLFEKISSNPNEITQKELDKRWEKKRNSIKELQNNIFKLRHNVSKDMDSDNEKTKDISYESFIDNMFEDELLDDCFLFFEETPEYETLKIILQDKEKELSKK